MIKEAAKIVTTKVINASFGWGIGMALMVGYNMLILFLQQRYGYKYMLGGALAFMIIAFWLIDFWWHYEGIKKCARLKEKNSRY